MIKEFKIEGIENVDKCFNSLKTALLNPRTPLNESAEFMKEEALRNFPAEGGIFGEKWPPLRPTTIKIKEKLGYGGQPMMVRTGILRGSFMTGESRISAGGGNIEVVNPVLYAESHQSGVGKLPRRVLLKFAKKQIDNITNIFSNWVSNRVEKSFST